MYDNWLCGVDSLRYDEHCVIDSPTTAEIQLFEIMILYGRIYKTETDN